jgi:two-component system LytT family sensor kinase
MKLFFTKAERLQYLGFNDFCVMSLGLFPLAGLGNVLFGGSKPGMNVWESFSCYGIAFAFSLVFWITSRFVVLQMRKKYPLREETVLQTRILATSIILLIVVSTITLLGQPLVRMLDVNNLMPQPSIFYKIVMSYTLVIMVVAVYEGIYFFTKYKQSLLAQEKLAKENMQAQLSVLKQQMNPHFLFNSLNTLVNIIPEDSDKAALFTQRLASVYRRILEYRHKELIPVTEELVALQDYIFLMQTRFEDKLVVEWCLSDETMQVLGARPQVQCEDKIARPIIPNHLLHHRIVPLSVQLLVENAIKHNVISTEFPLTIRITLGGNSITVSNKHQPRERKLSSTGWGHENLRERYKLITDQKIRIKQTKEDYSVSLPVLSPELVAMRATA